MTIEEEIFENAKVDLKKLLEYGFLKKQTFYVYEKKIHNQEFSVIITISSDGKVNGKIIELCSKEEFVNFRIKNIESAFSTSIKEEYMEILESIKEHCFYFSKKRNYWVVPANPKYYDVISHFEKQNTITWKQPVNVSIGDILYIYIGSPYSSIFFQCEVINVNFTSFHGNTMELRLLKKYDKNIYTLEKLRQHGLNSVRCIRKLPEETILFLEENMV